MSLLDTDTKSLASAEILLRQLEALDTWNAARHQRERMISSGVRSREAQVDAARRMHVLNHAHQALLERTGEFLTGASGPLAASAAHRAVIAHRHEWLVTKMSDALRSRGVFVVGVTDSGAEALGLTVAEQPELLFTGDRLTMMTPGELLAEVTLFSPRTLLAVQVAHSDLVGVTIHGSVRRVRTRASNTSRCATPSASPRPAPSRPSDPPATARIHRCSWCAARVVTPKCPSVAKESILSRERFDRSDPVPCVSSGA